MKNLGEAKSILGVETIMDRSKTFMFLTQQNYLKKVLIKFGMSNAKQV